MSSMSSGEMETDMIQHWANSRVTVTTLRVCHSQNVSLLITWPFPADKGTIYGVATSREYSLTLSNQRAVFSVKDVFSQQGKTLERHKATVILFDAV